MNKENISYNENQGKRLDHEDKASDKIVEQDRNGGIYVFAKILVAFSLLLVFRLFDFGTFGVIIFFLVFASLLFHQLYFFRKSFREIYSNALFKKGSILRKLFEKRTVNILFGIFASTILALNLMVFIFTMNKFYFYILFMDIFFLLYFSNILKNSIDHHFQPTVSFLTLEFVTNFSNVILLFCMFIALDLSSPYQVVMTESMGNSLQSITDEVIANNKHSCVFFRTLIRLSEFQQMSLNTLRAMDGFAKHIFWILYVFGLSFFPFLAVSLIYKSASNLKIRITSGLINRREAICSKN